MLNYNLAEAGYKCDDKDIDDGVVTELNLWYSNTFMLYRTYYSWCKNYARKMKRGVYTKKLAIELNKISPFNLLSCIILPVEINNRTVLLIT